MGRSFNDMEREYYSKQIYDMAEKLFSCKGFKKTTIDQITEQVGIAKGSFYTFYASKEALFFRILLDKEIKQDKIFEELLDKMSKTIDFKEAFITLFDTRINEIKKDAFMQNTLNMELMGIIWSKIGEELQLESIHYDQEKLKKQLSLAEQHGYRIKGTLEEYTETIRLLAVALLGNIVSNEFEVPVQKNFIHGVINELLIRD